MSLQIRDYAIVDQIDIEFAPGMTVLTGETGAGKSILVDALGLVLGERGSAQLVRDGGQRAEFSAAFDIARLPAARTWLQQNTLESDDECLLRRVISPDGRSRAFINGNAVPLSQLKNLGELLLDIHGQHFHQSLAHRTVQRDLLDHFGDLQALRENIATDFSAWQSVAAQLQQLTEAETNRASRLDLLSFQLQELDSLALGEGEIEALTQERQKLLHSSRLFEGVNSALVSLFEDDPGNANTLIAEALRSLQPLVEYDASLQPVVELLNAASIHVTEAAEALRRYGDTVDMDPGRRDWVEERLDAIQTVARKHRIAPASVEELTTNLRGEYDDLVNAEKRGRELETQAELAKAAFLGQAHALSKARHKVARTFGAAVTDAMSGLGMPGGQFEVAITPLDDDAARAWGVDQIEFLISANPGQVPQPLARIASGGELSRMSLAIQVIASDGSAIPTMVFDEVDSGVGGGVAEMVGRRLQELASDRQVLCVTHLPQVASLADQHFRISKVSDGKTTRTKIHTLSKDERVEELARMLGGVEITRKTLEHAKEMLDGARQKRA
ncbi:MAG: DNA repair protein RecN [Woeseiaceae bacterium]